MPYAAPKPCSVGGVIVRDGTARCDAHKHEGRFADRRRGTRHERGYGAVWQKTRTRILTRDNGVCQPCLSIGRLTTATEVDHRVPKAEGGTDDDGNLQSICRPCHQAKTATEAARGRGAGKSSGTGRTGPDASPDFCARRFQGRGG